MTASPASDPQRAAVYKMEKTDFRGFLHTHIRKHKIVQLVRKLAGFFGVEPPHVSFKPLPGRAYGWAQPGRIILDSERGLDVMTVIHEMAHIVMFEWDHDDLLYPHGPEWAGVYGMMLHSAAIVPIAGFKQAAKKHGVRYVDPKTCRSPGSLHRAVRSAARRRASKPR